MIPTEADLVAAIESTLHFYPPVAGVSEDLGIRGVHGRITAVSHPLANLVGMAHLSEADADATIARVKERYASRRLAFGWITGPGTTPRDLPARLARAGLEHADSLAGMARTDLRLDVTANPLARIEEIRLADAARESAMMAAAYGMPEDVARLFDQLLAGAKPIRVRGYFAYLGDDRPVAWSYLVYVPGTRIVLLGGAATLPEARQHGLYTALVKRRLDDARADGSEAAIIQADRNTSAPICAKLGFRELCGLEVYAWSPPA